MADGLQVDVSRAAAGAGIHFPVFLSRAVYLDCVAVRSRVADRDEAGRLWDLLWMLRPVTLGVCPGPERWPVTLFVPGDDACPHLIRLAAICGPLDLDDPSPAITVLLPGEAWTLAAEPYAVQDWSLALALVP